MFSLFAGTVGHEVDTPSKSAIKKTKSYATFDATSSQPLTHHISADYTGDDVITSMDQSDMVLQSNGTVAAAHVDKTKLKSAQEVCGWYL